MKNPSTNLSRWLSTGMITLICLLALPPNAQAKGPRGNQHGRGHQSKGDDSRQYERNDRARQLYSSHPRSGFVLSLGNGYSGRGYYYGPPNSPYYYQRSDVRYYATREAAPREYYGNAGYRGNSMDYSVQRELAHRGYYRGHVDGQLGSQSRRAIAGYQRDRGMRPTGTITSGLLRSLGLQ